MFKRRRRTENCMHATTQRIKHLTLDDDDVPFIVSQPAEIMHQVRCSSSRLRGVSAAAKVKFCQLAPTLLPVSLLQYTLQRIVEVAVQQPAICEDQSVFCRLLQVCKAWRAAVQQAGPCLALHLVVDADADSTVQQMRWRSCAGWVRQHARQLRSIQISGRTQKPSRAYCQVCIMPPELTSVITGIPLTSAVAQASAGGRSPLFRTAENDPPGHDSTTCNGATPRPGTAPAPAAHSPFVHLQSFSSNLLICPAVLSSLSATGLTQLLLNDLVTSSPAAGYQSALAAPLARLTGLRHLRISSSHTLPRSYLSSVCKLRRLSTLELHGIHHNSSFNRLPQQLQQLSVRIQPAVNPFQPPECLLDLKNLTNLVVLRLFVPVAVGSGSTLPVNLQSLTIECWKTTSVVLSLGLTGLSKLKRLSISGCKERPEQLQSLSHLPQLQELSMDYMTGAALPALAKLQGLRHLSIGLMPSSAAEQGLKMLTTLRQLTHLSGFDRGGSEALAAFWTAVKSPVVWE